MGSPAAAKWYTQRTNLCLRSLAGFTSLIALCIFVPSHIIHASGETSLSDLGAPFVSPVIAGTAYTLGWSVIAVCVELLSHKPIHPGVYVSFDLFAWAGLIATIVMYMLIMGPYFGGAGYECTIGREDCRGRILANLERFGTAMALLAMLVYFGLFVRACIATHKLRKGVGASKKESNDSDA